MLESLHALSDWMVSFANTPAGPWALFGLAFAESSFFPIPPDVLLIAMGLSHTSAVWWFALICTIGSGLGGGFGYAIGRWGGRPLLNKLVSDDTIEHVESQFQKYDVWAIFVAGFTPIPYKVFTIAGGVFYLNFWRFLIVSFISRGARFFLVAAAVWFFGEQAKVYLKEYMDWISIGFVVLLIGGFWLIKLMTKRKAA